MADTNRLLFLSEEGDLSLRKAAVFGKQFELGGKVCRVSHSNKAPE
jgi:hypothetical protein